MSIDLVRLKDVFANALGRTDPTDRAAYLDAACAGDPALRSRVDALLRASAGPDAFLDAPSSIAPPGGAPLATTDDYVASAEAEGTVVAGRYKLLQQIGEGGMGTVWMADQTEPVKRRVAVKLIRVDKGLSKTILSRFEAERQAIALMDHPHIARLLDAGTTAAGAPFFVMELVKGVPLTEFCDAHRLGIPQRLHLFMQICSAVQHAHQKGIIHRDLKPGNILVESHDGKPVPKVIDFGLAKATSGLQLSEHTLYTAFGSVMGTPLYMAPEQATFNAVDVDTRADVYALGVILYELLTGTTPLTRETIKQAALEEMLKLIREQEAPTPSARLSASAASPSVAANRQTDPVKLGRFVQGELDWIALKALAKERDRRYETASGFGRDIERFLNHEPVTAGPPTARYRLKKFVRRHRGQVLAAGLVLLTLVCGIAGTTLGLIEAWRQEAEAKKQAGLARDEATAKEQARAAEAEQRQAAERAAVAEKAARVQTQQALTQIEKGVELFAGMLAGINPRSEEKEGKPLYEQLRERAERAADQLQAEAVGDPLAEARLQSILGNTLRELGSYAKAIEVLERSRATRQRELGADHSDTLTTLNNLALAYGDAGRTADAIALNEQVRDARVKKQGADHPHTLTTLNNLALAYQAAGRTADAIALHEQVREAKVKKLGADHPDTLNTLNNVALTYRAAGRTADAIALFEQVRDARVKKLGADHPDTLTTRDNLAAAYQDAGRTVEAIALHEQVRDARVKKLGADHPDTVATLHNLAGAYQAAGRTAEAIALFEQVRDARVKKLGAEHPDTLTTLNNLAMAYLAVGRTADAIALFEQVREAKVKKLGADHPDNLATLNNLAAAYHAAGRTADAITLYEQVRGALVKKLGADHPSTLTTLHNLAAAYRAAGRTAEAIFLYEQVRDAQVKKLGADHPNSLITLNSLAAAYLAVGRTADAIALHEQVREAKVKKLGADHPDTLNTLNNVALTYRAAGRTADAIALFEQVRDVKVKKLGADHPDTLTTRDNLAAAYQDAGRTVEAIALHEQVRDARVKKLGADHPSTLTTLHNLATAYQDAGRTADAIALYKQVRDARVKKLGADHPDTLTTLHNLAVAYWSLKRLDRSIPLFEDVLARREKTLGRQHPDTLWTAGNLGVNYQDAGRVAEAIPLLEEAYQAARKHPTLRWVGAPLLNGYLKAGRAADAARLLDELLADARKQLPKDSLQLAGQLAQFSLALMDVKSFTASEPLLRECLAIREKAEPDVWTTFNTQSLLGESLLGQKKYADAEPLLLKGYEGMKQRAKTIPPQSSTRIPEALDRLVELYTATNQPDEVKKYRALRANYPEAAPAPREGK